MSKKPAAHDDDDKHAIPCAESVLERLFRTGRHRPEELERVDIHEGQPTRTKVDFNARSKEKYFKRLVAKRNTQGLRLAPESQGPVNQPRKAAEAAQQTADRLDRITDFATETSVSRSKEVIDDQEAILLARKLLRDQPNMGTGAKRNSKIIVAEAVVKNYEENKTVEQRAADAAILLSLCRKTPVEQPASSAAEEPDAMPADGGTAEACAAIRKSARRPLPKQPESPKQPEPTLALEIGGSVRCTVTYPNSTKVKKMCLVQAIPEHNKKIRKLLQQNSDILVPDSDLSKRLRVRHPPSNP